MKIAIFTLGCRLNFAETEELLNLLNKKRFEVFSDNPEIIIIRGCSVTSKAERETRLKINELRKKAKKSFIVATGCLPYNFSSKTADLILPKDQEKNLLSKIIKKEGLQNRGGQIKKIDFRTRSFIKIQDGCSKRCAYCLTSLLRGKERFLNSHEIIRKIKEKERNGFNETVLTGVNIGEWKEKKDRDLTWLLKKIFQKTNIPRIRISSLWPDKINDNFLDLFKEKRFCRHLHLSLQTMSQTVINRMVRAYQIKNIANKINKIRKLFPDLTISADIIVGFPGETEDEFKENLEKLKKIDLAKIHIFRFSPRQGTSAILMGNQVNEKLKRKRSLILLKLSEQLNRKWRKIFLGQKREVLFEQKKNGFWLGLTDNYLKVYLKSQKELANKILSVKLVKLYKEGILATTNYEKNYENTKY